MTDRTLRRAVAGFAFAGAAIAAYLVYARYTGTRIACATGGCETVQRSRYSTAAGVPVAVLGLGAFLAIGCSALVRQTWALAAAAAIGVAGAVFAGYLLLVQVLVLHAICQWCVASDAVLAFVALAAIERLRLCRNEVQRPRGWAAGPATAQSAKPTAHGEVTGMKLCTLRLTLGHEEECPTAACPFWEEGGAALDADCGVERLGLDLKRRDLAAYLLELRTALEGARSREEIAAARATLAALVPPDLAGC